ncbi:MAG: sulfatase-like hydrolase/transferase [Rikenellaceae bacterium]|nr:sulfatase-like hydrolase/transferase [Rikenellaceae bacterium]
MRRRIYFLLTSFVVLLLLMTVARGLFMLDNLGEAADMSVSDGLYTLVNGGAIDLSVALLLMLLPLAMVAVSVPLGARKWWRGVMLGYYVVLTGAFAVIFTKDALAYGITHHRLDYDTWGAMTTEWFSTGEMWAYAGVGLLFWAVGAASLWLVLRMSRKFSPLTMKRAIPSIGIMLAILLFGASWCTGKLPRYGAAYFSSNRFMNEAAVNPLMSLVESSSVRPDYSPMELYARRVKPVFEAPKVEADTLAEDSLIVADTLVVDTLPQVEEPTPLNPLLRNTRPNILMLIMNGVTHHEFDVQVDGRYVMWHLNQLCSEGYLFENFYANSRGVENAAIVTLTSGCVTLPGAANQDAPFKSERMVTLPRMLDSLEYNCEAWYGGDYLHNNMRAFLYGTGFDNVVDHHKLPFYGVVGGVDDGVLLPLVADRVVDMPSPFFCVATLRSMNSVDKVPYSLYEDVRLNAAAFIDEQIGVAVRRLKYSGAWDNMLVIVVGDSDGQDVRVPLMVVGGAVDGFGVVSTMCSQMDVPQTVARAMELGASRLPFGEDLMSADDKRVTFTYNGGYGVVVSDDDFQLFTPGYGSVGLDSAMMMRKYLAEGDMCEYYRELMER